MSTATFDLVVRSSQGSLQTLRVNANDAAAATAQATQKGLQVLRCEQHAASAGQRVVRRGEAKLDVAVFSQELATLVSAGLGIVEALRTLAAKEHSNSRRSLMLVVSAAITEGMPLSAALSRHPEVFPALLVATVTASEQTGDLSTALTRFAQHQGTFKALRDKVSGAAVYPLLLLAVGAVVVLFLLGVVVPKFATLIESTRKELPFSSQILMGWGRMVAAHPALVGGGALAFVVGIIVGARQTMKTGARAKWIEQLPVIGTTVRQFRHAQLYRTAGMLVRGGIAAPRAFQLSATLLSTADQQRLHSAITLIQQGRSISHALAEAHLGDPVSTSMLAVAERTGALAEILERIAEFHEAHLQRSIELTSRLFEPALMIIIGLVIGAIVVLMYLPIFDLASSLQ
jgi:general secretion pathway protein F